MNVRLLISFEKAFFNDFTNTFITTLLGIFHQEMPNIGPSLNVKKALSSQFPGGKFPIAW
jgi:hypothetical protein